MSADMPFKPLLAFQDAGCTHVLCGNGAHFVWEHGAWREMPPVPQSAREAEYAVQQLRLQPLESLVLATLDRATAEGRGLPASSLASDVAALIGRPMFLIEVEIDRLIKAGVLMESPIVNAKAGRRRRMAMRVIQRATDRGGPPRA